MDSILEALNLTRRFGSFTAVDDLSFTVNRGDVYGFLGPNGAGKSTTLRMILSLLKPDSGSIRIFGKELQTSRVSILKRVGCIVEKPDFYKYLDARKNLRILASYSGVQVTNSRIDELLDFVGLNGRGADSLSGYSHGMRQRLGLAQALLHDPELIILDEPTTGLDPQGIIDIRKLIQYLSREKGKTIILSSHILHELELVSNRLLIMNKGKLVVEGKLTELLNDSDRVVEIRVDRPADAFDFLKSNRPMMVMPELSDGLLKMRITLEGIPEAVGLLTAAGFRIYAVESRRQLEDLFLRLTESAERMRINPVQASDNQSLSRKG